MSDLEYFALFVKIFKENYPSSDMLMHIYGDTFYIEELNKYLNIGVTGVLGQSYIDAKPISKMREEINKIAAEKHILNTLTERSNKNANKRISKTST